MIWLLCAAIWAMVLCIAIALCYIAGDADRCAQKAFDNMQSRQRNRCHGFASAAAGKR